MFKFSLINFFILLSVLDSFGQAKEFDLLSIKNTGEEKPQLIYLTATWCKPCMDKLGPITSKYQNDTSIKFIVLFDRYGYKRIESKIANLYDTSFFYLMPKKYYTEDSKEIVIKVNPSKKALKNFIADYNSIFNTSFADKRLWLGNAIIIRNNKSYITKNFEKEKLLSEIDSQIHPE